MRSPSVKRLVETFKLDSDKARLLKRIASATDDPDQLRAVIESGQCGEETARYVSSLYSDPYNSRIWRVTVALHAINRIVDGHGVEGIGPPRSGDYAPPFEYVNMGDPYVATLVYSRDSDNLYIGSWGDVAERLPAEE